MVVLFLNCGDCVQWRVLCVWVWMTGTWLALCTHRPASEQGDFGCRMLQGTIATGHVTSHRPRAGWPVWRHILSHSVRNRAKAQPPIMSGDQRGQIRHPVERGWGQQIQLLWAEVTSSSEHAWNHWFLPPIFQRPHGPSSARTVIAKCHTLTQQKMFSWFRRLQVRGQSVQGWFLLGLSSGCRCRLLRRCPLVSCSGCV